MRLREEWRRYVPKREAEHILEGRTVFKPETTQSRRKRNVKKVQNGPSCEKGGNVADARRSLWVVFVARRHGGKKIVRTVNCHGTRKVFCTAPTGWDTRTSLGHYQQGNDRPTEKKGISRELTKKL